MKSRSRRSGRTSARGDVRRVALFAVAAMAAAGPARANGRFPAANLVAFDPGDPSHLVVSTTFGLLESRDRGGGFFLICRSALGPPRPQGRIGGAPRDGAPRRRAVGRLA